MGDIAFEQVWKVYPDGTQAVRSVDLAIDDGALMVLVGPSGCGKTTLISVIAGILDHDEGDCSVFGHDLKHMRDRDPQELLGVDAQSGLVRATIQATIVSLLILAALTVGPYWWDKSTPPTKPAEQARV